MTEQEWLASEDPAAMLRTVRREHETGQSNVARVSDRKLRLFACACCRHPGVWVRLGAGFRRLVLAAEQAIEGLTADLDRDDWEDLQVVGWNQSDETMPKVAQAALLRDIAGNPWRPVTLPARPNCKPGCPRAASPAEPDHRLPRVCPDCGRYWECPWLTPQVLSLAQAAYDERADDGSLDPVRLAILADALEEAGCDDEHILRHLRGEEYVLNRMRLGHVVTFGPDGNVIARGPQRVEQWQPMTGPHVRGCHAVDLILGKE